MRRLVVPLSPIVFLVAMSLALRPQVLSVARAAETTTCACTCPAADPSAVVPVPVTDAGVADTVNPTDPAATAPTDAVTAVVAPATAESAVATDAAEVPAAETATDSQSLSLNELFPDPVGDDTAGEFIEIRNSGTAEAILSGWKLTANAREFVIRDVTIGARAIFQFPYLQTKLPLANGGATVSLIDPSGRVADTVNYGTARTGQSYARDEAGVWRWSERPTPGTPNEIVVSETVASRSASGSAETTATAVANETSAAVAATAAEASSSAAIVPSNASVATTTPSDDSGAARQVIINEFLPNPGSGGDEWIELFNPGTTEASLAGWLLDDIEGGSKPHAFTAADRVPAAGYLVLRQSQTKIGLNNDGDAVRLLEPSGATTQTVTYSIAPVGKSFARAADGGWQWLAQPSPGIANTAETTTDGPTGASNTQAEIPTDTTAGRTENETVTETTVAGLTEIGDELVTVDGVVTLPPGRLAKTVFAIQGTGGGGIIVRSYAKELPRLTIGDVVLVTGRMTDLSGQRRLAAPADGGIRLAGRRMATKPDDLDLASAASESDGALVMVNGSVTRFGRGWLRLTDEAGETELKLLWPGLDRPVPGLAAGAAVRATGVIKNKSGRPEIIVGSLDDLKVTAPAAAPAVTETSPAAALDLTTVVTPAVLGKETYPWRVATGVTLALLGMGAAIGYWLWRRNRWQEA